MVMRKDMRSHEGPVILSTAREEDLFPVGFEYVMGDIIYRVTQSTADGPTQMRKLSTSDGREVVVTVQTMIRDFEDAAPTIIKDPNAEKTAEAEKAEKTEKNGQDTK